MLPIKLKLSSLKHSYIQLPQLFTSANQNVRPGAIVSITSVLADHQLVLMWNGQPSSGEYAELDLTFAQANKFHEELVVISLKTDLKPSECNSCIVKLKDDADYTILSQHTDLNLLDTCKLINKGLVISLWLSKNVSVLVEVTNIEPNVEYGFLTTFTEMHFEHSLKSLEGDKKTSVDEKRTVIVNINDPIALVSCSLGHKYNPKYHLGSLLIVGQRGSGKSHLIKEITESRYKGFKCKLFNCKQLLAKRPDSVKKIFAELVNEAIQSEPFILALDDIDAIVPKQQEEKGQEAIYRGRLVDLVRSLFKHFERLEKGVVGKVAMIATARSLDNMDEKISKPKGRHYFNDIIKIDAPDMSKRMSILRNIIKEHKQVRCSISEVEFEEIARNCDNYMPMDLRNLVERSIINACSRSLLEFNSEPLELNREDLLQSINGYTPSNLRNVALKPKSLKSFEDVGGMREVKETLLKTILLQIKYPKLFARFPLRMQSSILLYGPPGCGKTLIAEALTNQAGLNSLCIRGPELLSKYIGASEAAVRELFARAHLARPCVIFFDEFESLVSKRGADSTGVTDRIVNQFLSLMDGVERLAGGVFVIAASSRPDMIDPAVLRPGRLDKHLYCAPPDQLERHEIFTVLGRRLNLDQQVDLLEWSKRSDCFTGADIQSLLYSAQLKGLHAILSKERTFEAEPELTIKQEHLEEAFEEMRESVLMRQVKFNRQHGKFFMRASEQKVATRATLI